MDPYLWKRLWRRPWLSLCSLIFSAVLCFLLCYLSGYQQAQQAELLDTQKNYDILCVVTNRKGNQASSLRMGSSAAYFVQDTGFSELIRDVRITKEFQVTSAALGISEARMLGVTNESCAQELDSTMGNSVVYLEEGFYDSEEYICLVSEEIYRRLETDTVNIYVIDPFTYPISEDAGIGNVDFRVAGYYSASGTDVFIPFPASQRLCGELSNRVSSDSIAFFAKDNLGLEELSRMASTMFGTVDPAASDISVPRIALTIHDEQYRATVAALEQNIQRTAFLLPLVMLLGLGMGFLISFLATRGERRTYALMRTLGMTRGKLFFSVLREQLLLVALAVTLTGLVTENPLPAVFYFLCHTVGCCAAVVRSVKVPPTAILREQE